MVVWLSWSCAVCTTSHLADEAQRIHPQSVATATQAATRLTDSAAADNFRNLFELPVLFYFALATAALTNQVTAVTLALAWAFVVLRVAHSVIHCTYNKVMHRFQVYLLGAAVLLLLWLRLGYGLLGVERRNGRTRRNCEACDGAAGGMREWKVARVGSTSWRTPPKRKRRFYGCWIAKR